MTFISYAQNFEDIVLWRALSDVPNGFYIDIGANDPIEDSVTKAFYERGWRGINVEPIREHFNALVQDRPRDTNLPCAIGDKPGKLTLYEIDARGLATNAEDVADRYRADGRIVNEHQVEVTTLAAICESYAPTDIHFLKIDVEGFERNVLLGADFLRFRPWILAIESTEPNSPLDNSDQWEPLVTAANYSFAYFDGLNRFYVADEHQALRPRLALAPNVFDRAKLRHGHCFIQDPQIPQSAMDALQLQLHESAKAVVDLRAALVDLNTANSMLRSERDQQDEALANVHAKLASTEAIVEKTSRELAEITTRLECEMVEHSKLTVEVRTMLALPLVRAALALHGKQTPKQLVEGNNG